MRYVKEFLHLGPRGAAPLYPEGAQKTCLVQPSLVVWIRHELRSKSKPAQRASKTARFLAPVSNSKGNNTIIHKIVTASIFVAQGGWLTRAPAVQPGQKSAIALEVNKGLSNVKGTARWFQGPAL